MRNFLAVVILFSAVFGCASLQPPQPVEADRDYVVGTWAATTGDETFLPDGTYCLFMSGSSKPHSTGKWQYSQIGIVSVNIESSLDPKAITPPDLAEIRMVQIPMTGELLMGYPCSHCPGGIAGAIYRRLHVQRTNCAQ